MSHLHFLLQALNGLWIGTYKLQASQSRFTRNQDSEQTFRKQRTAMQQTKWTATTLVVTLYSSMCMRSVTQASRSVKLGNQVSKNYSMNSFVPPCPENDYSEVPTNLSASTTPMNAEKRTFNDLLRDVPLVIDVVVDIPPPNNGPLEPMPIVDSASHAKPLEHVDVLSRKNPLHSNINSLDPLDQPGNKPPYSSSLNDSNIPLPQLK
ncbi:hypothetical protein GH714_017859 [Hevea brasiliensis]|uniref:Uncharacterized protein n=1 Tax=Hevea brasiliensis TaxID=3981 RepID=A0A6A6KCT1_HEVBR|nr:hypothetical protein GH714_017859 [Hevea brasiliensis]